MRVANGKGLRWVYAVGAVLMMASPSWAQSTIFNIPTTDTVSPKKGYFEFDYLVQAPPPDTGQFQIFVPRIVVGVGPMVEVGVNLANTTYADGGDTISQIQPNIKFKFYANDDAGVAAAAGVIFYTPVNHRDDNDSFGLVYGNVSKKVKSGNYGPRFTAGIYGSVDYGDDEQVGALLGYEQPVGGPVSVVADWFSGKNFWGYFTPGLSIVLPHSGLLNIGYSLGNDSYDGNKNRALFVYYGITFP
jgi:hypothetical protein